MAVSEKYRQVHSKAFVVDGHADTILKLVEDHRSLGERGEKGAVDLPRLQEGGVDLQFFAFWVDKVFKPTGALKRTLFLFDAFDRELQRNEQKMRLIKSFRDIEMAGAAGKVGALFSIEGGEAIEGDLSLLRVLFKLGFRSMGLTHNDRNQLGDGAGEANAGGLTELGFQAIEEMNRLGMVVDLAHLSDKGFYDALEISKRPLIVSHACCRTIRDDKRNLSDTQIHALAKRDGLVGVAFISRFLAANPATIDDVVNHISHIARLVGVEHVGLGSDFDGTTPLPKGLEDVTRLPGITRLLLERGFSDDDVVKILGGNYLRVLQETLPK